MEKYSPILEALDVEYEEEELYNKVAEQIIEQTNEYTETSGVIVCPDAATVLIAQDILNDVYNTEIKPLQQDSEYDLAYHVVYNKELDEEKKGWVKKGKKGYDFGLGGIKFLSDRGSDKAIAQFNRALTPAGDMPLSGGFSGGDGGAAEGGGMGESWSDPEEETICPLCGGKLSFIGGQGNYWEYNCDDCGEWLYLDSGDRFYKANTIWKEDKLEESIWDHYGDGSDDLEYYLTHEQPKWEPTEDEFKRADEIKKAFEDAGFFNVEVVPRSGNSINFDLQGPKGNEKGLDAKIYEILDKFGAEHAFTQSYDAYFTNERETKFKSHGGARFIENVNESEDEFRLNKELKAYKPDYINIKGNKVAIMPNSWKDWEY